MSVETRDQNMRLYEAEIDRLMEQLDDPGLTPEQRNEILKGIKELNEAKLLEEEVYSEQCEQEYAREREKYARRREMVPEWVPKILAIVSTTALGVMIYKGELSGKVVGSAAVQLLGKLRF